MPEENTPPASGATPPTGTPVMGTQTPSASATPAIDPAKELEALRQQHANRDEELERLRKFKANAEKAQADADKAKLDDLGRAQKELEEERSGSAKLRKQLADQAISIAALKLKFRDPEDAVTALSGKVEIDDATGLPKDLDKALEALAKAKPYLLEGEPPKQQLSSGGATNPGRSSTGNLSRAAIDAMSSQERMARHDEILQWLASQK